MTVFIVIQQPHDNADKLPQAIANSFPDAHYQLASEVWLVSSPGTVKEVCDKLGISDGESGAAVVAEMGSYYGRANPNIWSWIKRQWESK